MTLPDLDSSLASVRRQGGGEGGHGALDPHCAPPSQIQDLLSPQDPPRPLEADRGSPNSGEPSPRPLALHPLPPRQAPLTPLSTGKQLVHYTAQPLFLVDPSPVDVGNSELPVLFELGEGSYFSEGDDYTDDPTISLLMGSEPPKAKDPTVS